MEYRIYVYGFLSITKNFGKNISNKYSPKRFDNARCTTDTIATALKRTIQKYQKQLVI